MIPKAFVKWFGEIPSNIIVTTNTGCNWRMTTRREGNDAFIDQGWTAFAVAHQLKVGQFLTFRKVSSFEYSVVIFDHTCTEVVSRCPYHGDDTRCEEKAQHVPDPSTAYNQQQNVLSSNLMPPGMPTYGGSFSAAYSPSSCHQLPPWLRPPSFLYPEDVLGRPLSCL
ncbi:hypothetical protein QYE76_007343 [Lolium multiflorum]|uniref:TF-B3 domain-containing protein n=1 Tax=Lolium multiflorum TaxID=4521 RepID=A0AAD8RWJ4_LOLMU|nr:hypothetical protein QYE76_007343 [Lolium multiflorum]